MERKKAYVVGCYCFEGYIRGKKIRHANVDIVKKLSLQDAKRIRMGSECKGKIIYELVPITIYSGEIYD